jgi:CheY-like chemotaxis protein
MERSTPPSTSLLVVESIPALRAALMALLAEEGYVPTSVSSLEEALAALERQTYALVLADLFAGVSRHAFTPAHILRRRAQPIPLGLLTTQAQVLEDPHQAGFAFALPRLVEPSVLLTEIAAGLNTPLSKQQQHQAQIIQRFLKAWSMQAWREMLLLCTEEVVCYPSGLFGGRTGSPIIGKLALLARLTQVRRAYHRMRIESQGIYSQPHGLAVRYMGSVAAFGKSWEWVYGVLPFTFASERICQIGRPLDEQRWASLLEAPDTSFG